MPLVQMPDGAIVDMPEQLTPEQRSALEAKLNPAPQSGMDKFVGRTRDAVAQIPSYGADIARGAGRGLAAMTGSNPVTAALSALFSGQPAMAGAAAVSPQVRQGQEQANIRAVDQALPIPQGESPTRQYVRAGLEGAGGGLLGGGAGTAANAVIGGISGLGSEAAARVVGDNPLTRGLGGLVLGGAAIGVRALRSTRGKLADAALRDVSDADLATARQNMEGAQVAGVPLNLSQAMPRPSNIDKVVEQLANNPYGAETTRILRNQPQDVTMMMRGELNSLPGKVDSTAGGNARRQRIREEYKSVFTRGTLPDSPRSDILTLERKLRTAGRPDEFADAAKTWLASKLSSSTLTEGGRLADDTASAFERTFQGNPSQERGFRDILVGLARSQGLPDDALLPGMHNLMKYVGMAARRPGTVGGLTTSEVRDSSKNAVVGKIGAFSAVAPFRGTAQALNHWLSKDAYTFMDKAVTTPEGVEMLRQMAKGPTRTATNDAVAAFLGTLAATPTPGGLQPNIPIGQ